MDKLQFDKLFILCVWKYWTIHFNTWS